MGSIVWSILMYLVGFIVRSVAKAIVGFAVGVAVFFFFVEKNT